MINEREVLKAAGRSAITTFLHSQIAFELVRCSLRDQYSNPAGFLCFTGTRVVCGPTLGQFTPGVCGAHDDYRFRGHFAALP